MNLNYTYWYFQGIIKPEICDRIINIGKDLNIKRGEVNREETKRIEEYSEEEMNDLLKFRDSHISWIDEPWIHNLIKPLIQKANEMAGWNFQWDCTEIMQFTIYNEGQYYEWHPDQHHYVYGDDQHESMRGKYRKLSSTLLLNDPSEFEGGDLEFHYNRKDQCVAKELNTQGSLVVFPSFVYHRVLPITKGTRYSLVSWNLGDPFK